MNAGKVEGESAVIKLLTDARPQFLSARPRRPRTVTLADLDAGISALTAARSSLDSTRQAGAVDTLADAAHRSAVDAAGEVDEALDEADTYGSRRMDLWAARARLEVSTPPDSDVYGRLKGDWLTTMRFVAVPASRSPRADNAHRRQTHPTPTRPTLAVAGDDCVLKRHGRRCSLVPSQRRSSLSEP
jgi:hypothetical protein